MHSYATNSNEYKNVYLILAIFSILSAWLLHLLLDYLNLGIWMIDVPSVFGFYYICLKIFNKYIWKFHFLRTTNLIKTPNLNGNWVGEIESSHDNFQSKNPIKVSISQTWTKIIISLESGFSKSKSEICGITISEDKTKTITYQYLNEPLAIAIETMEIHKGTASLSIDGDNKLLSGIYYSGRGRQNYGTIELKKKE